jgi:hypothetical protein
MIEVLPDIPRVFTALAEWSACMVYILLMRKRLPTLPVVALSVVGLAVLVGVQLLAETLPLELWTVGMAAAVGAMFALIYLSADVSLRETGDLVARAFVLAELVASLEWQLDVFFLGGDDATTMASVALLGGVYAATFGMAYSAERRHFPRDHRVVIDNRTLIVTVGVAVVTFLMSNLSFVTTNTPFSGPVGPEVFYIRTLVDLCGFVILYALRGQRLELLRATEVDAVNVMLRNQRDRYLQSKHDIDVVNRKYHDLKYYIHAIRAESNPDARAGYMDQLEDSISGYETSALDTGSHVLDTLLTAKMQQSDRMQITLAAVADGTAIGFVDAMDLVTLIGNALDNAIEATSSLEDPAQRLVRIAVFRQGGFAMIKVENVFRGTLEMVNGLPQTTKAGALHHGYGLKNMRETAEKYGGSLTAHAEDGWFVVRVLLPSPRDGASHDVQRPEVSDSKAAD